MDGHSSDVDTLLMLALSGDVDAFGQLFDRHRNWLRLIIRAQMGATLRKKADSNDMLQETFLTASKTLSDFRGRDIAALLRWLEVIALRRVCDASRRYVSSAKRAAVREVSLEDLSRQANRSGDRLAAVLATTTASPSHRLRHSETLVVLADAIAALPDDYQQVVELRFLREQSLGEVADAMGRSKGAVTMLLARAVRQLRATMDSAISRDDLLT